MKKLFSTFSLAALAILTITLSSCSDTQTANATPTTQPSQSSATDYRNSKADVVVLNFFDMYCGHCQKDAKYVNELHSMIQNKGLAQKINIYGIGWSNTDLETSMYRKRFHVTYPLISDKNRTISSRFGKVRTPLIIALKKEGGQWKEFYRTHKAKGKTAEIFSRIQP